MKNFSKAGLLIITLVIPALIFVFLKFFARNHYEVPYFHPLIAPNGVVAMEKGDTVFHQIPSLNLKSADHGSKIEDLTGNLTVIGYVPENCGDTCRLVLAQLERISNLRSDVPELRILILTVNHKSEKIEWPVRSALAGWKIVRADQTEIDKCLMDQLFFQTVISTAKTNSIESKLSLIDDQGYIRGYYDGSDPEETDRLMAEIKILNYESETSAQK